MKLNLTVLLMSLAFTNNTLIAKEKTPVSENKKASMTMNKFSDQQISQAVIEQLMFDHYFKPDSLLIKSENGIVLLNGTVESLRGMDRAVNIAESIKGVRGVVNQLKVMGAVKTDDELKRDVVTALALDPTTDAYKVDVFVNEGVVTLSGTVNSKAEKNLAEWVVRGIHGVREVTDNVAIDYKEKRSDADIAQDVRGKIKKNPYLEDALISVSVTNGIVDLTGEVGTLENKNRAENLAWVNGVKEIKVDRLKLNPILKNDMLKSATKGKTDAEIKDAIADAFFYDPRVFSFNPKIEVINGVVNLTGSVSNLAAKFAAEQDAANVFGVVNVLNDLKVENKITKSDNDIKADVLKSLSLNLTDSQKEKINIDVKDGKVTLNGSVNNPFIKNAAFTAASRVIGVKDVETNLVLKDSLAKTASDSNIKAQIEKNLKWNPYLDQNAGSIKVNVEKGVAKLTGDVKSWKEYMEASDEALRAGAQTVENNLSINNKKINSTVHVQNSPTTYEYSETITY